MYMCVGMWLRAILPHMLAHVTTTTIKMLNSTITTKLPYDTLTSHIHSPLATPPAPGNH